MLVAGANFACTLTLHDLGTGYESEIFYISCQSLDIKDLAPPMALIFYLRTYWTYRARIQNSST